MWLFKQQADIFQTPVPLLPFLNSAPCNQVHNPVSGTHTAFACWIFDSLQIEDFFFQIIILLSALSEPGTPPLVCLPDQMILI